MIKVQVFVVIASAAWFAVFCFLIITAYDPAYLVGACVGWRAVDATIDRLYDLDTKGMQ